MADCYRTAGSVCDVPDDSKMFHFSAEERNSKKNLEWGCYFDLVKDLHGTFTQQGIHQDRNFYKPLEQGPQTH